MAVAMADPVQLEGAGEGGGGLGEGGGGDGLGEGGGGAGEEEAGVAVGLAVGSFAVVGSGFWQLCVLLIA